MNKDRFKIRVWDKVFSRYWIDEEIKENAAWLLFPDNDNIHNIEVEQCTGLKDKKGKLIFEGDVISYDVDSDRVGRIACVQYNQAHFFLCRNNIDVFELWKAVNVEVLGNIHKNPELLK